MLALVGEPGIGKTALLDYAAERATGMRVLRARGIESEAQIPFASLLELLRPGAGPARQDPARRRRRRWRRRWRCGPAAAQDRFAVGAATLSLLAAYAERGAGAVLIDDAHWLDGSSAQALLFAFRRLVADPIAVLIAVRDGEPSLLDGADLPTLRLGGLSRDEAAQLAAGLAPDAARRLHEATGGQPAGAARARRRRRADLLLAPEGAPVLVSARISRRVPAPGGLLDPPPGGRWCWPRPATPATWPTLERAAARLGIDLAALPRPSSAAWSAWAPARSSSATRWPARPSTPTPRRQRRDAHRALAAALPDRDVDRRAWHLAAAAAGPDEAASAALEQAARRSRDRSAYATAAAAFERAGRLAADGERRARLLLAGGRGRLAGRAGRPRRRPARRGSRAGRRPAR